MNLLDTLKQLRDDLKTWVTNNLNALNAKIDEKTIPIDKELSSTSTNPVQNKTVTNAINNIPRFSGSYNDLTDAPNIAEDDSGNMVIADESGNIIFKADANGIHTTAVSLNGEAAASEKYVDEAIANIDIPEVDFTGYATEDFVNTAIDSAKEELGESIVSESNEWKIVDEVGNIIFSVDADGAHTTELTLNGKEAATKEYVDNVFNDIDIPEVDFTGYATENYVDNKVADLVNSAPEALNTLGELAAALENHEDAYDALLETVGSKATHTDLENLKEELSESITAEAEDWKVVDGNGNIIFSVDNTGAHTTSLTLNGEEAATKTYVDEAIAAIPKTDLTGYATEKYVDDAVAAIDIPETDLSDYYTKEQTDTAINTAKEELGESIVAESDEWKVVDEAGNIIFSVDASGAHTTALTLNGESVEDIIDERVASLVDSAPDTLNTLNELASALGDDPNFATTVATEIGKKVDKVDGKGLSTNDFTDAYRDKLDNLENISFEESDPTVPAWAKESTKPTYTADEVGALSESTVLADLVDDVNHRTVSDAEKTAWNAKSEFSGNYEDLNNAPNIVEDNEGNLVIADNDGNIIFRSDADGFETTQLTAQVIVVNGMDVENALTAKLSSDSLDGTTIVNDNGTVKVNTTNVAEAGNTLPITSAAVYAILGDIEAALAAI